MKIKKKIKIVNKRNTCRVCYSQNLKKIFDLGVMPLAGNFIKKKNLRKNEIKVPLVLYFCVCPANFFVTISCCDL